MSEPDPDIEVDPSLVDSSTVFRADPGAHWPAIIVFAMIALLSTAGGVWLIIKPGAIDLGRGLTGLLMAVIAMSCVIGAWIHWVRLQRRYRLTHDGLDYFDGRQSHEIPWTSVTEIYEEISSVKLLGFTMDSPQLGVEFVTSEGVRCQIDKNVRGADQLAPIASLQVNRRLRERARQSLGRRQSVAFGCVSVSEKGIVIQEPRLQPWWEKVQHRFESAVNANIVVAGEYAWHDVHDVEIVSAVRGDRMSDRTIYNQLQVCVEGRHSPVLIWAIPEFPNFTILCEVLEQLGRPIGQGE